MTILQPANTGMPPSVLQATNLHKAYGTKPALKGVSLALQAGTLTALLGPNGAGKSTLLQLLTGLFNPDRGEVHILGHAMHSHPARALAHLGVVFQQSALDLDLTVQANLLYHADLHGMPRHVAKERMAALLSRLGLSEQAKTTTRQLSGGNRRKVELVRALLHQPQVLLMDEATVGLDPPSRQQLLATVDTLCHQEGLAVLWATHLIEEVRHADRMVLLHQGQVRFDGPLADLQPLPDATEYEAEVLRQLHQRKA